FDLLDAAARTDRLVVETGAGRGLVGVGPLGEHRIDEGRAGAGNVGRKGRSRHGEADCGSNHPGEDSVFHDGSVRDNWGSADPRRPRCSALAALTRRNLLAFTTHFYVSRTKLL